MLEKNEIGERDIKSVGHPAGPEAKRDTPEPSGTQETSPYSSGGVYALLPIAVVCDSCGASQEYSFALDLAAMSRKGNGLDRKALSKIRSEAFETAGEDRWLKIGSRVYCPECSDRIEAGEVRVARSTSVTAGDLVSDLYATIKAKKMERDAR